MPRKDTAVDRLHVSSNQRKQTVLTSYKSTEKNVPSSVQAEILEKGNIILKFQGHRSSHLEQEEDSGHVCTQDTDKIRMSVSSQELPHRVLSPWCLET